MDVNTTDLDSRTTYMGLLKMSHDYLDAFNIIHEKNKNITYLFSVKFYLLAHSTELSLKAYLRFKGYSVKKLQSLGHDLEAIYKELLSNFVYTLDMRSVAYINLINPYYKSKQFEYPTTGTKSVVELEKLKVVTEMINTSTQIQINEESK
jgi:hypothetical protein